MHLADAAKAAESVTDSMRMFQWGIEGGRPAAGEIGIAPEWFYKGNGFMLQAPFSPLTIPAYAEDGGEEAELAGIYVVGEDVHRIALGWPRGTNFPITNLKSAITSISPVLSCVPAAWGRSLWLVRYFRRLQGRFGLSVEPRLSGRRGWLQERKICATVSPISSTITSSSRDTASPETCMCTTLAHIR
jgi:hypothetical protein